MDNDSNQNWHLNKSVPIALIFAIFLQSVTAVWWASSINERVFSGEKDSARLEARVEVAERVLETATANNKITAVILERLEEQVRENNRLLRNYFEDN